MAELADAHGSGPCERKFLEVQVLLAAPTVIIKIKIQEIVMVKKFKKILALVVLFFSSMGITASAVRESTFVIIKPDCSSDQTTVAKIIEMIEANGYEITKAQSMTLTEEQVREHYAHHLDKPFFPSLLKFMLSGSVYAMIVEGENVVQGMIDLAGEIGSPGTIRGIYGKDKGENAIHRSDSVQAAQDEITRFFK